MSSRHLIKYETWIGELISRKFENVINYVHTMILGEIGQCLGCWGWLEAGQVPD